MDYKEFEQFAESRLIFLDGATGSNLIKRGMPAGVCPEKWILENKNIFVELQKEYVEAGSNIIYAPTFTANRVKLSEYGLQDDIVRINRELVALSKEAAGGRAYVAADITMTGEQLIPMGKMGFEELIDIYKEQIQITYEAGADLIVVETMMSLQETRAALIAAKEVCSLPVMVTLTFESDGKTLYGTDAVTAAVTLEKLGACAIGANCSTGPDKMVDLIKEIAQAVSIPVIAKPNAGLPALNEAGETVYDMEEPAFVDGMKELIKAGASIVGGCCGTSPSYIKALSEAFKGIEEKVRKEQKQTRVSKPGIRRLTSERKTVSFELDSPFMIVGERINPTGKKKLQEQLREGNLEMVLDFAEKQEECGAALLDINVGMSGIDEKDMMLKVLEEVTLASSLPLSLDSSHVNVLEAALRRYPGRALINSISAESEKLEKLLPIAKKYGAMFILLPLSDEGLPANIDEKIAIIEKIVQKALALGMTKEDIVVDGLVATIGANPEAAKEVLETIRYCKENGLATICGLSNISFGLPERSFVNTAFLTMAIREGLTMAIANPSQELLVNTAFASDLLMNKEGADIRYIERMQEYQERKPAIALQPSSVQAPAEGSQKKSSASEQNKDKYDSDSGVHGQIYQDVMKGNRKLIKEHTKAAVEAGQAPSDILNDMLLPAINEVGVLFDKGKYFLPQLIASAEAMKLSIEYLEPLLASGKEQKEMPVVVIATVAGDIHDIGKNLVAMMLKNYGFQVIDLGKDVPRETIIEAAREHHAAIIALSALMTTTMQEMKRVIDYAKEQKIDAKIMIGGAVITQEYADEIGADAYSKDAAEAVRTAKRLLGMEDD
ncbi:MAG: homocysteine S-methyltransferase family protein [Lachnospiraceae bacterium]|nr:homocysteine S-methyltransferase family protein [Lachnospiraceae bacterium]